jgi:hypothetical protein
MSVVVPALFLLYILNVSPYIVAGIFHMRIEPDSVIDVGTIERRAEDMDTAFVSGLFATT